MRHVLFVLAVALYVTMIGQNWAFYMAAVAIAAYVQNDGQLHKPVESTRF